MKRLDQHDGRHDRGIDRATTSREKPGQAVSLPLVASFLLVSGLCSLIFQVCWFREFRLVFGASTAASSTVLAVFMAGIGLGNWLLGRVVDRSERSPLRIYAALEIGVALMVAITPFLLDMLHAGYFSLGGQQRLGLVGATFLRLTIATIVLLVPTFLMGGTLPAAARAVTTGEDRQRHAAALLYGMNTLGAVCGSFSSTFVLIQHLGTRHTLWLACGINALTAVGAWIAARSTDDRATHSLASDLNQRKSDDRSAGLTTDGSVHVAYAVAATAGFTFFLMELVWYRMLGPILGGTTFTFGLILTAALAGIGMGAAAYPWFFPRRRLVTIDHLACLCALEAFCLLLPFTAGDEIAIWAARLRVANSGRFASEAAGWFAIAGIVVFPAAFVSGLQFPAVVALLGHGNRNIAKQLGNAFGWNTIGAISGALAGGFGLVPLLSAPGVWRLAGVVCVAQAIAFACWARRSVPWNATAVGALLLSMISLCSAFLGGPTAAWRHGGIGAGRGLDAHVLKDANALRDWRNGRRRATIWEVDGVESSVAISAKDGLALVINGKSDGNAVGDAGTQIMLGILGAALHSQPRQALVVGLGTGESAGWLAAVPMLARVDVVELEPAVCEMAHRCRSVNCAVLEQDNVKVIFGDAREVLLTSQERYDLIVCEPSNPYRSGVANLFTQEFYHAGKRRLTDNGLFVQWLQAYETDEQTIRSVLKTFRSVFPELQIWEGAHNDLIIVGSMRPLVFDVGLLRKRLWSDPFPNALRAGWETSDVEGLFSHFVGSTKLVEAVLARGEAPVNTDDKNEIEYAFARTLGVTTASTVPLLRQLAAVHDDMRPATQGDLVNWETIDREREWFAYDRDPSARSATPVNAVLERHLAKDIPGMLAAWDKSPAVAGCWQELAIVGTAYAMAGDSRADAVASRLRSERPVDAMMIGGILAQKQGRMNEAVTMLETAIGDLRTIPWVIPSVRERACDSVIALASDHPAIAPRLLDAFAKPFPVAAADESRRDCALLIATQLPAERAVSILESYEPHVPWTRRFLAFRETVYRQTSNPLADVAKRELTEFDRNARRSQAGSTPSNQQH